MNEPTYRAIFLLMLWAAVLYIAIREIAIMNREARAKQRRKETQAIQYEIWEWRGSVEYEALQEMPSWDIKPGWNRLSQFFDKEVA